MGQRGAQDSTGGSEGRSGQYWWVRGALWTVLVGHRGALGSHGRPQAALDSIGGSQGGSGQYWWVAGRSGQPW
jgi:hypothetical protein